MSEFFNSHSPLHSSSRLKRLPKRFKERIAFGRYFPKLDRIVGPLKTAASQKPIPMDAGLSALLLDWRSQCPYNQTTDYVFASVEKKGQQPLWPSSAMSKHIRPAAKRAGILKHVRWHVFRHSFATLLKGNGEDVKTVQESLRHADGKVTLDTYTQGLMPVKRAAQRKLIEAVGPAWLHAAEMNSASA